MNKSNNSNISNSGKKIIQEAGHSVQKPPIHDGPAASKAASGMGMGDNCGGCCDCINNLPGFDPNTLLTVAGVLAGIGALAALIALLTTGIKVRFQKYVKMLFRMQKDFIYNPDGLDMTTISNRPKGLLAKIFNRDTWARFLFGDSEIDKETKFGVIPFIASYRKQIGEDYKKAVQAFNKIAIIGQNKKNREKGTKYESVNTNNNTNEVVYESFYEALKNVNTSGVVNEDDMPEQSLTTNIDLSKNTLRIGNAPDTVLVGYKDKNSKTVKEVPVKVTKQSTREVCFAIISQFLDKYVNTESVFRKMGVNVDSFQNMESSTYDNFKKCLKAFNTNNKKYSTGQYQMMEKAWDSMIKSYDEGGQRIIKNFRKYTLENKRGKEKAVSEKTANQLESGNMKLVTAWNDGIIKLKGNFPSVVTAVTSSSQYVTYYNFIVEKVLPLLKTGVAGDADYVLDVLPKVEQYYIIRKTADTAVLGPDDNSNKAAAICKVTDYNIYDRNRITIKILTAISGKFTRDKDGYIDISNLNFETDPSDKAYGRTVTLEYPKWTALDPMILDKKDELERKLKELGFFEENNDGKTVDTNKILRVGPIYQRQDSNSDNLEYVFAFNYKDDKEESETTENTQASVNGKYTEDSALYDSINEDDANTNSNDPNNPIAGVLYYKNKKPVVYNLTNPQKLINLQNTETVKKEFQSISDQDTLNIISDTLNIPEIERKDNIENIEDIFKNNIEPSNEPKETGLSEKYITNIAAITTNTLENNLKLILNSNNWKTTDKDTYSFVGWPNNKSYISQKENDITLELYLRTFLSTKEICTVFRLKPDNINKHYLTKPIIVGNIQEIDSSGNLDSSVNQNQQTINLGGKDYIIKWKDIKDIEPYITQEIKKVNEDIKKNVEFVKDSVNIHYSISNDINESVILGSDITVSRNIDVVNSKDFDGYYILSETVWNDGNINNIEDYLNEHIKDLLNKKQDQIYEIVKSSKDIMIKAFTESLSYKVNLPKNRVSILTQGNSLYESVIAIKFNKKGNIVSSHNLGIHKIEL